MRKVMLTFGIPWLICIAAGFSYLFHYANTPGKGSTMKGHSWPLQSKIEKPHVPTLLIFAHPYCPCTTATLGELERLMPEIKEKVKVVVLFVQPEKRPLTWVQGSNWEMAKKIPGVMAMSDFNYHETDIFGAKTSGQVMFFDAEGEKVYSGGITPSRGHMGDSIGRDMILSWVEGKSVKREIASVFGCSLREE
jgi:hypothetical protein